MRIIYDSDFEFSFNRRIPEVALQISDSVYSNDSSLRRFNSNIRVITADNPSAHRTGTILIQGRIGTIESTGELNRSRPLADSFSTGEEVRMGRPSFVHGSFQNFDDSFMPDEVSHEQSYTWNEQKSNRPGVSPDRMTCIRRRVPTGLSRLLPSLHRQKPIQSQDQRRCDKDG